MPKKKPFPTLDPNVLENFRKECVRSPLALGELKIDVPPSENEAEAQREAFLGDLTLQRVVLTLFYAYSHYFSANPNERSQLCAGCLPQGERTYGVISGIFPAKGDDGEPAAGKKPIDILIAFDYAVAMRTTTEIKAELKTAYAGCVATLTEIRGVYYGKRSAEEERLQNLGFAQFGDDAVPLTIRFLLPINPTPKAKARLIDFVEAMRKRETEPAVEILFGSDIDYEVRNVASAFPFVPEGSLRLDQGDNACHYCTQGPCKAHFVNVSALSLRRLWQEKAAYGLLAQNLRYYVSQPRIDDAMLRTMAVAPRNFWYLNNGLTIVCKSCQIDGEKLTLQDFSIVNGGQTTHNIGTAAELACDFFLPCKIIEIGALPKDEQSDFIAEVCTATNSQKPIKAADAVANLSEIRGLRTALKKDPTYPIHLITKVNEPVDKKAYPEPWQRLKTADLGKLLLAFVYQYPCTARTHTKEIFEDTLLYKQIFGIVRKGKKALYPPAPFVRDLAILWKAADAFCKHWKARKVAEVPRDSREEFRELQGLAKNGLYPLIACVGALLKLHTHPELKEKESSALGHDDVAFPFLKPDALAQGQLDRLFDHCLRNYLLPGYLAYYKDYGKASNDYSNFFKQDKLYREYILLRILRQITDAGFAEVEQAMFAMPSPEARALAHERDCLHPPRWGAVYENVIRDLRDRIYAACENIPSEQCRGCDLPRKGHITDIIARYDEIRTIQDLKSKSALGAKRCDVFGQTILDILDKERPLLTIDRVAEEDPEDDA